MSILDILGEKFDSDDTYKCPECGNDMIWENKASGDLVCEECGYGENIEHHGLTDEEYEELYPVLEDDDESEDDSGERYDEVYNELNED